MIFKIEKGTEKQVKDSSLTTSSINFLKLGKMQCF